MSAPETTRPSAGEVVKARSGSNLAARPRSRERPESARLTRCRASRRRSLNRTNSGRLVGAAGTGLNAPKQSYFPWFRLFLACGKLPFVPSILLAQMREEAAVLLRRRPLAAPVFASARYSGGGSPGSVRRATERADSEFESLATNGLRSNHGRAFSSCAASRNSVGSSP
jgi:hypothetical protein